MGFRFAPTRASTKTIEAIVDVLCRYYGVSFSVRFDESAHTSSINLQTGEITLPSWLTKSNQPKIISYANHEPWHAMPSRAKSEPKTKHRKLLLEARAVQNGINQAALAVNMITDLIINDAALDDTPFPEDLPVGFESIWKQMRTKAKRHKDELFIWFAETQLARLKERAGKSSRPTQPEELYTLLYHDQRSLDNRFDAICRHLKPFFAQAPWKRQPPCGYDSDELPPITDPEDYKRWSREISRLPAGTVFKAGKDLASRGDRRVLFDVAELAAWNMFIVAVQQAEEKAQKKTGMEADYETWRIEDPVEQLDIPATLKRHGVFIPGITTLKRVGGVEETQESHGRGLLVFVLDLSGSMFQDIALVALLCWASVLCAKKRGDEIAMASFGASRRWLMEPCKDYERARSILEEVQATEASTHLAPALRMVHRYASENRLKPTLVIFSDCAVFDEVDAVKELRTMQDLEGQAIIASTTPVTDWLRQAKQEGLTEVFQVDYENIGDMGKILTRLIE